MDNVSTGIIALDSLIDSIHIGDNMVWEVEAGTSDELFMQSFINSSLSESKDVIYVSFNRSPQSILLNLHINANMERLTILDCFTSGKGKSDRAFLRFYENQRNGSPNIIRVNRPSDISLFSETINGIQDGLSEGARYVFDSLTGMQDLWGDENSTYKFFTYMCPRLYDLRTVAYWILEKDAHSQAFKANLRHITQVVLDLSKKKDKLFLRAVKLDGRTSREAFKPHSYEINDDGIDISPAKKEVPFDLGSRIKETRIRLDMSQKELAEKIGMTSSFISQLENNQISPSLSSFLQIAEVLGISPSVLLQKDRKKDKIPWLISRKAVREKLFEREQGYSTYNIISGEKTTAYLAIISPETDLRKHFLSYKKEELIHVMKGEVSVTVESRKEKLKAGDSIFLKDSVPSAWSNSAKEEAELLVICC